MTKFFFLSFIIFFISCAHTPKPEVGLDIPINPEWIDVKSFVSSRTPASAEDFLSDLEKSEHQKKTSLRRVYFKALYDQYLRWNQSEATGDSISFCPQYHHDKLVVEENHQSRKMLISNVDSYPSKDELAASPGWSLSMMKKGKKMRAFEWGQRENAKPQEAMSKAIKGQWRRLEKEVHQMCEDGVSENFFKIENIVTYFSMKEDFDSGVKGLRAFMKIPVFTNVLIENSLNSETSMVELSTFEDDLLNYASAWQIRSYAVELKKQSRPQYAIK